MVVTILKLLGVFTLALVALVGCQTIRNSGNTPLPEPSAETLRIATYNVHYIILDRETGDWSVGDWERRKAPLDLAPHFLSLHVSKSDEICRSIQSTIALTYRVLPKK